MKNYREVPSCNFLINPCIPIPSPFAKGIEAYPPRPETGTGSGGTDKTLTKGTERLIYNHIVI
jgi:hypothetical protein